MNAYEEFIRDAEEDFEQRVRDIAAVAFNKVVKPVLLRNGASFRNADGQLRFSIGGNTLEIRPLFENGLINYFVDGDLVTYQDKGFVEVGQVMTIEVMGTDRTIFGLWMDELE